MGFFKDQDQCDLRPKIRDTLGKESFISDPINTVEFKIKKQESKPMEIVRDLKLNKTQSNFDIATDFLSDPFLPEV